MGWAMAARAELHRPHSPSQSERRCCARNGGLGHAASDASTGGVPASVLAFLDAEHIASLGARGARCTCG